jgi:hypothetical protein
MRRTQVRLFATPLPALLIAGILAFGGGSVAAIKATEAPAFCAKCHEMQPYHDAWSKGPHKDVSCVACHVAPGTTAEVTHKISALKEVMDHFTSSPRFPRGDASVPNERCVACHTKLPQVTKKGFAHAAHVTRTPCVSCHPDAGHKVELQSLAAAGVLVKSLQSAVTSGSAEATGHIKVDCSRCHDVAKTACEKCHAATHEARGTCTTCHSAGPTWAFAHPGQTAACTTCHERPNNHFQGDCSTCHEPKTPFEKTVFKHTSNACTDCHIQPNGHIATAYNCATCHNQPGKSWAFAHPDNPFCTRCHAAPAVHFNSDCASCHDPKTPFAKTVYTHSSNACASCHTPPANHHHSPCSTCHSPSVPFAKTIWTHPSSKDCGSCHKPSHGAKSAACSTCHKDAGSSWSFTHPSSSACVSCHTPPSSHFGAACSSCHTPQIPFASTKFSHPRVNAPHGTSGIACSKCHPSGPPQVGCTCHGGGPNGPN